MKVSEMVQLLSVLRPDAEIEIVVPRTLIPDLERSNDEVWVEVRLIDPAFEELTLIQLGDTAASM